MENKFITITVENSDGTKMSQQLHYDSDIWDWAETFKTIMIWLTFTPKSIENIMRDKYDEEA